MTGIRRTWTAWWRGPDVASLDAAERARRTLARITAANK